jgi:alpha-glucuronidase
MTPLGLAHQMGTGHHYGPAPWVNDQSRPEWNPVYYNRADRDRIGFDRTATGSDAVAQYAPPVARRFANLSTVGDDYLLWFHHVPWDMRLDTGRTVWDELLVRYGRGLDQVAEMQREWQTLRPFVDRQRFDEVAEDLAIASRSQVVARCFHRLFPERVEAAAPGGRRAAATLAPILRVAALPERPRLAALASKGRAPSAAAKEAQGRSGYRYRFNLCSCSSPTRARAWLPAARAAAAGPDRSPSRQ